VAPAAIAALGDRRGAVAEAVGLHHRHQRRACGGRDRAQVRRDGAEVDDRGGHERCRA
jgi:hypothetical protein